MKTASVMPFKHLSAKSAFDANISIENYSFTYVRDGVTHAIMSDLTGYDNRYYLHDNFGWDICSEGMTIQTSVAVGNPRLLYDIVSNSSTLGIGLITSSLESNRTEAIKICNIPRTSEPMCLEVTKIIAPHAYRDEMMVRIVLFLDEVGEKTDGFAHVSGTILGTLAAIQVVFDKQGQMFPTEIIDDHTRALWDVECRWVDANIDTFTKSNIRLVLNKHHTDYKRIDPDSPSFDSSLFREVMASAMSLIIFEAMKRTEWSEIVSGDNHMPGTVASVLSYMINTIGLDVSSPSALSSSIRAYLQEVL